MLVLYTFLYRVAWLWGRRDHAREEQREARARGIREGSYAQEYTNICTILVLSTRTFTLFYGICLCFSI